MTERPTLEQLRARVQKSRHREIGNWLARRVARPSGFGSVSERPLEERCLVSVGPAAGPPMIPARYNSNYQIVQTADAVVVQAEMIHEARIIRLDRRSHLPSNIRQWLGDSLEYVFKSVPDLAGVFTITASENLTNCASHGHSDQCPLCRKRSPADIIAGIGVVALLAILNVVGVEEAAGLNIFLAIADFLTQVLLVIVGLVLVFSPETLVNNIHLGTFPTWSDQQIQDFITRNSGQYDTMYPNGVPTNQGGPALPTGAPTPGTVGADTGSAPQTSYQQLLDTYRQQLPVPNQIVGRNWYKLAPSEQQFLTGAYEALGYDPSDLPFYANWSMPGNVAWNGSYAAVGS